MKRNRHVVLFALALCFALAMPGTALAATGDLVAGTQGSTGATAWTRLAGRNALGTMMEVVQEAFGKDSCDTVIVATQDGYWDALTASGLAGKCNCPVLLTNSYALSDETRFEIARVGARKAIIVGGSKAVGNAVQMEIRNMGLKVVRASGATAVETALDIYEKGKEVGAWSDTAIVVTSTGYWDALSISPYSYVKNAPIFLASVGTGAGKGTKLDSATLSAIRKGGFTKVYICGGKAAVSGDVESQLSGIKVKRLWGSVAAETSQKIAEQCVAEGMNPNRLCVATDGGYWDGLTGAALCGQNNSPLLLATPGNPSSVSKGFVAAYRKKIDEAYILGGTAVVPKATETALKEATK